MHNNKTAIKKYNGISVIMPTYNQSSFLSAAIKSVFEQSFKTVELIIINDGCTDDSDCKIQKLLKTKRNVKYLKNKRNRGLGFCLNKGIQVAKYDLIAYLPSDDIYYPNHLSSLYETLLPNKSAVASFSGIKYNYNDNSYFSGATTSTGGYNDPPLQLVQILHKKNGVRWKERKEIVTDSLSLMFWSDLKASGAFVPSQIVTAEWVSHADQRHKIINEFRGGNIYKYKKFYGVDKKLRFISTAGYSVDENTAYAKVATYDNPIKFKPLKILLVGELAYNADRIILLKAMGHQLYGLWLETPYYYNTVGPLSFCEVEDIKVEDFETQIKRINPDIIYALLNNVIVDLAHKVLKANLEIPFVWHFKEGPFFCRDMGVWEKLIELYEKSDGQIYINEQTKDWFSQYLGAGKDKKFIFLDGDLPLKIYFKKKRAKKLSDFDGEVHTVIPGRPFGLTADDVVNLSIHKIHLHLYGTHSKKYWQRLMEIPAAAKNYLHLHPSCSSKDWTYELSKYDAGWLHVTDSNNFSNLLKVEWPDLNFPARMTTLAAAGLPMIQKNNSMHIVATQAITKKMEIGLFYSTISELSEKLRDKKAMKVLRDNCWKKRDYFSFDYHVNDLVNFFNQIIENYPK